MRMAGGAGWWRRCAGRARTLRTLLKDTQRALRDVAEILHIDPEISAAVQEISNESSRPPALVILGCSPAARARLLHCLLGRPLLPDPAPRGCRWLRIQYGSSTAVHLTLGNSEFELVEELRSAGQAWETLPTEDLLRQDSTDLATVLEIELNNPFLKDGLKIILPPDIDTDPGPTSCRDLKRIYSDLYTKRDLILKNFTPIYLYAVDKIGKSVFSENIMSSRIVTSRSEEDFWETFNLYYMTRSGEGGKCGGESGIDKCSDRDSVWKDSVWKDSVWKDSVWKDSGEPSVFSPENCLDLHQIKDLNPNAQIFFVLFSDSVEMRTEVPKEQRVRQRSRHPEATESTESEGNYRSEELPESDQGLIQDKGIRKESSEQTKSRDDRRLYEEQIAFMNELLDQWEMMSSPPPKHHVKSQWVILDDAEILRTADHKAGTPYLTTAIQNAGETCGKGCKREDDRVKNRTGFLNSVVKFATESCQSYLLEQCTKISEVHVRLLQQFILASFDMARELQVVPKKIQYVATQEQQLYETINEKFSEGDKKQELVQLMQEVLQEMRGEVDSMDWSVDDLPCHQDRRFVISNSIFYSSSQSSPEHVSIMSHPVSRPADVSPDRPVVSSPDQTPSDGEEAVSYDSYNLDDYDIIHSNDESLSVSECYSTVKPQDESSLSSQIGAIRVENESEMFSLSGSRLWGSATLRSGLSTCTTSSNISVKQASLDVQQTVLSKLSRKISLKLVNFVDCLKDTYFGTLERCLESLESSCRLELGGRPASEAMRALLSVARQVDLQPCASFSLLRSLLDSFRRLLHRLRLSGEEASPSCCVLSAAWRRRVAAAALQQLAPQRLARIISAQILERLGVAHARYQAALAALQGALAARLHHTGDVKLAVRRRFAPGFARLCLESTSMCDLLMYGVPELAREIGRGQYGVVYAARGGWAGRSPCAVKSVLPADERHYHELAMEFFYTRSIPVHPRIVRLYGSIVQRHSGAGPSVLLVSERKVRDLHAAVRAGLSFAKRMRLSCDIVEGIRYLHSLGLVHRDIKMKNVLLDSQDRASLSDLGFCAAESLISGSVVGTPVHMAPELLAGDYDAAVDVYAFGILFWYVCAGNIRLPSAFEVFQNKEQLWSKVKRGLRPERLPHFTDACWEVMESCWASEPSQRAHLGHVQPKLEAILQQALEEPDLEPPAEEASDDGGDDSLDMTGMQDREY